MANALKDPAKRPTRVRLDPAIAWLGLLLLLTSLAKFTFRRQAPLWLDEAWTGMIASQRSFGGFLRQCNVDVNAPLYYIIARLWAPVSGLSNAALRFPAALFACAAPLIVLGRSSAIPRDVRLIWCGLIACWIPGLVFAADARSYSLVLLLATANALAYASLLRAPSLRLAFAWTGLSALLVLAHYAAGLLVVCQGVIYILVHRQRAVRTWPAVLAFLPPAASLAARTTVLIQFTTPGISALHPLTLVRAPEVLEFLLGTVVIGWLLLALAAVSLIAARFATLGVPGSRASPPPRGLWLIPGTSLAAAALFFAIGLWRPIFFDRYLTAMVPGTLLGLALIAQRLARSWRLAPVILLAVEFGLAIGTVVGPARNLEPFSFQQASEWLMDAKPRRLVFLWDSPLARHAPPDNLAQVGGFFFERAGRPLLVDPVYLQTNDDPNPVLLAHAKAPGSAILWLYDPGVPHTEALVFPPALHSLDPRWTCRDLGNGIQHALACRRD